LNKSIVKRLSKFESATWTPRWRLVILDSDGFYSGECGNGLTKEQFQSWVKQQDNLTQIVIVEVICNRDHKLPGGEVVTLSLHNHLFYNTNDLMKSYEAELQLAAEIDVQAKVNEIMKQRFGDLDFEKKCGA
jgi:hypothetical protein